MALKNRKSPYTVEVMNRGCRKCGHGKQYCIIETSEGRALAEYYFNDKEDARYWAKELNDAYSQGQASGAMQRPRNKGE